MSSLTDRDIPSEHEFRRGIKRCSSPKRRVRIVRVVPCRPAFTQFPPPPPPVQPVRPRTPPPRPPPPRVVPSAPPMPEVQLLMARADLRLLRLHVQELKRVIKTKEMEVHTLSQMVDGQ